MVYLAQRRLEMDDDKTGGEVARAEALTVTEVLR
jgi:hypothetical protein